MMLIEVMVAMAILVAVVMPLTYVMSAESHRFRAAYERAAAMEIVDGEMEILAAGEWRGLSEGTQPYTVHAQAAKNLPPGRFQLTRTGSHLRLEWTPTQKCGVGTIVRETTLK